MEKITVYEKPTCTTCRKTVKALSEKGFEFDRINYYIEPFNKKQLVSLLKKMEMTATELLRKNEQAYKDLDVKKNEYTEEQILDFMIKDHNLIQRPIVEYGDKAILARPIENLEKLF